MSIPELLLRLVISFVTLLVLTRIMGRKEISQMTFFNFISAISIGTIGASLAIDSSLTVKNGMISLFAWSFFTVLLGLLSIKSKSARMAVAGRPLLLMQNGLIIEEALRKARLDLNQFRVLLRQEKAFSLNEVEFAIFETNGRLSIQKKEWLRTATKKDLSAPASVPSVYPMAFPVILDGQFDTESLVEFHVSTEHVIQLLHEQGISSASTVFYAELETDRTLYVSPRSDAAL